MHLQQYAQPHRRSYPSPTADDEALLLRARASSPVTAGATCTLEVKRRPAAVAASSDRTGSQHTRAPHACAPKPAKDACTQPSDCRCDVRQPHGADDRSTASDVHVAPVANAPRPTAATIGDSYTSRGAQLGTPSTDADGRAVGSAAPTSSASSRQGRRRSPGRGTWRSPPRGRAHTARASAVPVA